MKSATKFESLVVPVFLAAFLSAVFFSREAHAQGNSAPVNTDPNYIFATVLGTGVYDIDQVTISVLRLPFRMKLREVSLEEAGFRLLLPVTIGFASLDPDDPIARWVPDEFNSFSFVPGVEYRRYLRENILLKPFAQLGGGYDSENSALNGLVVGGSRIVWEVVSSDPWLIRVGSSLQWAAERQEGKGKRSSFGLFELGIDFRRNLPWTIGSRQLNGSVYGRWKHFIDDWNIASIPGNPIDVNSLYEVGLSLGWEDPIEVLGLGVRRFSVGTVFGDEVTSITLGFSFPF